MHHLMMRGCHLINRLSVSAVAFCLDSQKEGGGGGGGELWSIVLKKVLFWVQLNCLLCTCFIYHLTMIHGIPIFLFRRTFYLLVYL